jgi:hypothetical protein
MLAGKFAGYPARDPTRHGMAHAVTLASLAAGRWVAAFTAIRFADGFAIETSVGSRAAREPEPPAAPRIFPLNVAYIVRWNLGSNAFVAQHAGDARADGRTVNRFARSL